MDVRFRHRNSIIELIHPNLSLDRILFVLVPGQRDYLGIILDIVEANRPLDQTGLDNRCKEGTAVGLEHSAP